MAPEAEGCSGSVIARLAREENLGQMRGGFCLHHWRAKGHAVNVRPADLIAMYHARTLVHAKEHYVSRVEATAIKVAIEQFAITDPQRQRRFAEALNHDLT